MTFKTKFKIGDYVEINGKRRKIEGVRLEVGAVFKLILYRYYDPERTQMLEIPEEDVLKENS